MKEPKIDQLFRQKLHQHSVAPTPAAWDQLDAKLNSKRRKRGGFYYAAAAAVALLLSFGWLWMAQRPDPLELHQTPAVAVQETPVVEKHTSEPDATEATAPVPAAETDKNITAETPAGQTNAQLAVTETSKAPRVKQQSSRSQQAVTPLPVAEPEAPNEMSLAEAETQKSVLETMPVEVHPIAIEPQPAEASLAHAEQVIIRYDATLSQAVAMQETSPAADQDEQTGEKVLSILQKVKQGEIGLADIRQAKDRLLSGRINKP